jgi:hypothetical protein
MNNMLLQYTLQFSTCTYSIFLYRLPYSNIEDSSIIQRFIALNLPRRIRMCCNLPHPLHTSPLNLDFPPRELAMHYIGASKEVLEHDYRGRT